MRTIKITALGDRRLKNLPLQLVERKLKIFICENHKIRISLKVFTARQSDSILLLKWLEIFLKCS